MVTHVRKLAMFALLTGFLIGCETPSATLDLIAVARKGLVSARDAQVAQHKEIVRQLEAQAATLDHAFDADVRLVASGQIKNAEGEPVALTAEWIISGRKGYVAARDLLGRQLRSTETAHATRLDNLTAADEALDLASQLIIRQWNVSERIKQQLMNVQRRFTHGR